MGINIQLLNRLLRAQCVGSTILFYINEKKKRKEIIHTIILHELAGD